MSAISRASLSGVRRLPAARLPHRPAGQLSGRHVAGASRKLPNAHVPSNQTRSRLAAASSPSDGPAPGDSPLQRVLRGAAATALSAALVLGAATPTFADAPAAEAATTSVFLPSPGDLFGGGDDKVLSQEEAREQLSPEERATVSIFDRNTPSVVNIANLASYRGSPFSMDVTTIPQGTGSGFIWDDRGHVVTNYHVVKGASGIKVTLIDSTSCSASIVGIDETKDIAVLKLDLPERQARRLQTVELGRSAALAVGQRVFAIGNPFGLDHTLTSGIVSGLQREIQAVQYGPKIKGVIQTDAAINPGNSGGVLLNSRGQLIGVNSAILDPSQRGAFSGVGFAIPIDTVKGLVEQILQFGQVVRPVLGITMGPPQLIARLSIDGVLVYSAPEGSPAAQAGIQGCQRTQYGDLVLGDIIVGINGTQVKNYGDLFDVLDGCKPGDKVSLDLYRAGSRQRVNVQVKLGSRSSNVQDG